MMQGVWAKELKASILKITLKINTVTHTGLCDILHYQVSVFLRDIS